MNRIKSIICLVVLACLMLPTTAGAYDLMLDGIYYDLKDGQAIVTNNGQSNCYSGDIVIPESVTSGDKTYPVTAIGKNAFMLCVSLANVTLPSTVTSIGDNAFAKCSVLSSIELPDALKQIGRYAFTMCDNITQVTIPDSVTSIGQQAFYACTALETLAIGKSVTTIGENAFDMNFQMRTLIWNAKRCLSAGTLTTTGIDSVAIGDEVEVIPERFLTSSRITHVALPSSVTSIGAEAFFDCTRLPSIVIPN